MIGAVRAELLKVRKRPATWVVGAVGLYFVLFVSYILEYILYRLAKSGDILLPGGEMQHLRMMLPDVVIKNVMAGLSFYDMIIAIIFGALASGSEYGWNTLKTIFVQRSSRASIYAAQTIALALVIAAFVVILFALAAGTSLVIATVEGEAAAWPPVGDVIAAMAGAWLILTMWAALGQLLGVLFRGPAPAIGVGLCWVVLIEGQFINLFSLAFRRLARMQEWLPWANATTLASSWGLPGVSDATPVLLPVSGSQYHWVPAAYLFGALLLGMALMTIRDVP